MKVTNQHLQFFQSKLYFQKLPRNTSIHPCTSELHYMEKYSIETLLLPTVCSAIPCIPIILVTLTTTRYLHTLWVKKNCATFIFTVTLANGGRFLKFFQCRYQKEMAHNKNEKFPTVA